MQWLHLSFPTTLKVLTMSKATIRIGSTKEFFARAQLVGRKLDRGDPIDDSFTLSFDDGGPSWNVTEGKSG